MVVHGWCNDVAWVGQLSNGSLGKQTLIQGGMHHKKMFKLYPKIGNSVSYDVLLENLNAIFTDAIGWLQDKLLAKMEKHWKMKLKTFIVNNKS